MYIAHILDGHLDFYPWCGGMEQGYGAGTWQGDVWGQDRDGVGWTCVGEIGDGVGMRQG